MKRNFFICAFILSASLLSLHAQIYTPDSIIQGSTGNNKVGIGTYQFIGDEKVNINGRLRIGTNQTYGGGNSLHIADTGNIQTSIYIHQAGVAAGYIGSKASDPNLYLTNDYNGGGLGAAAYSITIKNNGNVGIGTTNPQTKLDVLGDIRLSGSYSRTLNFGDIALINSSFGSYASLTYSLHNGNGYSDIITILGNGYVGIGTTDPQNKLDVYGTIRAQEIKVTSIDDWSDYVFYKDYKLNDLEYVERYIEANKHLPDVPSAKEVESSGLNLGEMNAILLKKVEELTLYVIGLNKKIERLEAEKTVK